MRGFSFIYSGNFLVEAEISETGRLRLNMGLHPMGLQWHLMPGKHDIIFSCFWQKFWLYKCSLDCSTECEFNTPEVVMTRSSEGLGGMSRAIHRLFLDRLLPRNWSDAEPPVLLNTWEAKYFRVNHNNIVEVAEQASIAQFT